MIPWYFYAIGATVFNTAFLITRKRALSKVHSMNFESARSLSLAFLCLLLIPFINLNIDKKVLLLVYIVSLMATIGILFFSKALRHEEISFIVPLGNIKPALVAVLAFFFLSETLGARQIVGIVILFLSAYLLESNYHFSDFLKPIKHFFSDKYSIFFVFALSLFSITAVLDKFIITNHLDVFTYFFLIWIFVATNFNIIHAVIYGHKDTINCFKKVTYLPVLVAGFSMITNLLVLKALSLTFVSLVIPILMLSSLFVVLLGGKFFHEKNIHFRLFISALMLVGAYLVII